MHRPIYFLRYFLLFLATVCHAEQAPVYQVYVVPQLTAVEIHKAWIPILEKLTQMTQLSFELKITPTIPAFEQAIWDGEADFAFMNPYHQLIAKQKQGYIPLIRDETPLTGILLVKKDSPVQTLAELNEKEVAFPAPNAFAASLYMRALLVKQGVQVKPRYVKTHSNVYRSVLVGDVVAGGGVNNTLARETDAVKQQLRILYSTPQTAPHPFSAHPRVPEVVQKKVTEAFLQLAAPEYASLLNSIQIPKPVRADYKRDYQSLESLNLDKFFVLENL